MFFNTNYSDPKESDSESESESTSESDLKVAKIEPSYTENPVSKVEGTQEDLQYKVGKLRVHTLRTEQMAWLPGINSPLKI